MSERGQLPYCNFLWLFLFFKVPNTTVMKKLIQPLVIFVFFPVLYSCDKIDELRSFDINTDLGYEYAFIITEQDPSTINDVFVVFINDQDILDNLSKIEEWKVNKLTYQITNYFYEGASDVILNGTLTFGSVDVNVTNVNLLNLYVSGEEVTLDVTDQDLVNLANEIKATAATTGITGSITGEVSGKPVWFNVFVKMYLTAKVKE